MAMPSFTIPDRVSDISDRDFWAGLSVPKGATNVELLKEAIRLGRAGRNDDAFLVLAAHHRVALAPEWEAIRKQESARPAPSPQVLRDLLNHKINAWHTQVVQFGRKIDWFPASLPSDCKHGYHYMGWFHPAVTAFVQTGDKKYRDFMVDILGQYYDARRDPRWGDIKQLAFACLGIAARWGHFLPAYLAMINSGPVSPRIIEGILKTFMGYGRAMMLHFPKFIPGVNSLAVGMMTHLHLARAFPEFTERGVWERKAMAYLVKQANESFYADGGNRERVWGYGLMHVGALANVYDMAKRYGGLGRHERTVLQAIRRAYQWYAKTSGPDPKGLFPTYGDAGTGNGLFNIDEGVKRFFPQATSKAARAAKAGELWGVDRRKSYLLEPSGFAVMRNGNMPDSTYVNINFGEFGGWHSHWDLLSMNFWSKGVRLLEELCRFGPYANPMDTLFRAPESHNLVLIDGMVYDNRNVKGEDVAWHSDSRVDYFSAYHRAYRYHVYGHGGMKVSPNIEAVVRRTVLLVKDPGYAVVLDSVSNINQPGFNRQISQYWHSPFPFQVLGPGRARTKGRQACLLVWAQSDSIRRLDTDVDFIGKEVTKLGAAEDRYSLRARRWMDLDHKGISGFTTVIYPFTGGVPNVAVRAVPCKGGDLWQTEAIEVSTPKGRDLIVLNPQRRAGLVAAGKRVAGRAYVKLARGRGEITIA